jgi:hypothetical protein
MSKPLLLIATCLIAIPVLTACGVKESIESIPEMKDQTDRLANRTEDMDEKMGETVAGIKDQRLLIPLQELTKVDNYDALTPIPKKLMPYGKKLAEAISADDMAELAYLWLKSIDTVKPPMEGVLKDKDGKPVLDKDGNVTPVFTDDQIKGINHYNDGLLAALKVVCGFLPEQTVTDLIQRQVVHYGRYEATAFQILMLRSDFIDNTLMQASILSDPLPSVGALRQAITYNDSIERIARLPFVSQIGYQSIGFLPPHAQISLQLDTGRALANWNYLSGAAQSDLTLQPDPVTGDKAQDQQRYVTMKADYDAAVKLVQARIDGWTHKGQK